MNKGYQPTEKLNGLLHPPSGGSNVSKPTSYSQDTPPMKASYIVLDVSERATQEALVTYLKTATNKEKIEDVIQFLHVYNNGMLLDYLESLMENENG